MDAPIPDAQTLLRWWDERKASRAQFDNLYDEAARWVWPNQYGFTSKRTPGERKGDHVYDDTPVDNAKKYAAVLEYLLARRGTRWHSMGALEEKLKKSDDVRAYFKTITDALFAAREGRGSGCYFALASCWRAIGVFGNDALWVDDRYEFGRPMGLRYSALAIRDVWVARDWQGQVSGLFRRYEVPLRDAGKLFPLDRLPTELLERAKAKPNDMLEVLLVLWENPDHDERTPTSKPWLAAEVLPGYRVTVREGGFAELPLITSRAESAEGEDYGRGWVIDLLPTIKTLNEMVKTMIRAGHKVADPPLLVADDGILGVTNPVRIRAGGLTRGGLDAQGRRMVDPMFTGSNLPVNLELLSHFTKKLDKAALIDLFTLLVERPQMTASEILERSSERGVFIGPVVGDQQTQKLAYVVERELGVLWRQRRLPPMPMELVEAGGLYKVEYETPAAQLQRAGEVRGLEEWLLSTNAIAERYPEAGAIPDPDKIVRRLAELRGVPPDLLKSSKVVARLRAVELKAAGERDALEMAPGVAKAASDLAGIQAAA